MKRIGVAIRSYNGCEDTIKCTKEESLINAPYRGIYDNERLQGSKETDFVPATAEIFCTKVISEKVWYTSSNVNHRHDNLAEYYFRRNTFYSQVY